MVMSKDEFEQDKAKGFWFYVEVPWGMPRAVIVEKFNKSPGALVPEEYILVEVVKRKLLSESTVHGDLYDFNGGGGQNDWPPFYGFFRGARDDRREDLTHTPGRLYKNTKGTWCTTYHMKDLSKMLTLKQLKDEEKEWGAAGTDDEEEEGQEDIINSWSPPDRCYFELRFFDTADGATGPVEERPHFYLRTPYDGTKKVVVEKFSKNSFTDEGKVCNRGVVAGCLRHLLQKGKVHGLWRHLVMGHSVVHARKTRHDGKPEDLPSFLKKDNMDEWVEETFELKWHGRDWRKQRMPIEEPLWADPKVEQKGEKKQEPAGATGTELEEAGEEEEGGGEPEDEETVKNEIKDNFYIELPAYKDNLMVIPQETQEGEEEEEPARAAGTEEEEVEEEEEEVEEEKKVEEGSDSDSDTDEEEEKDEEAEVSNTFQLVVKHKEDFSKKYYLKEMR